MSCSVIGHPDKERNRVSQWIVEDLSATRSSSRPNLNVAGRRFIDWGSSTCPTLPRSARLYSSPARPRHYWPTTTRTTFARWGLSSKRTFELGESRFQKRRFSSFVHRRLTALGRFLTRFEEFFPRSPFLFRDEFSKECLSRETARKVSRCGEREREGEGEFRGVNLGQEIDLEKIRRAGNRITKVSGKLDWKSPLIFVVFLWSCDFMIFGIMI